MSDQRKNTRLYFAGEPVDEMPREQLLRLIDWLLRDRDRMMQEHDDEMRSLL